MEPILIKVDTKNDKVNMTFEELQILIKEVYQRGKMDAEHKCKCKSNPTDPIDLSKQIFYSTPYPKNYTTAQPTIYDPSIQITCDAHNSIGD